MNAFSCSELQIWPRKLNGKLETVDEATSKSDLSLVNIKVELSHDSITVTNNESRVQGLTTTPSLLCSFVVQRTCSPPVVFIKIPRCSWTVGESIDPHSEVASPTRKEENAGADHSKVDCQTSESKAIHECSSATNWKDS